MENRGFEPLTSAVRSQRYTNCLSRRWGHAISSGLGCMAVARAVVVAAWAGLAAFVDCREPGFGWLGPGAYRGPLLRL